MELELVKLENGYKRFDPQRGMEYMLDLRLRVTVESGTTEIRYLLLQITHFLETFVIEHNHSKLVLNLSLQLSFLQ